MSGLDDNDIGSFNMKNNFSKIELQEKLWYPVNYFDNINNWDAISFEKKVGIVLVTHGNNGIFVKQALNSFCQFINNFYMCVYVNESDDPFTIELPQIFKDYNIEWIFIKDQKQNGGLTGAWNKGIDKCIDHCCETIIISNDDIFITNSIKYIIHKAYILVLCQTILVQAMNSNMHHGLSKKNHMF
jgi:hypothetical protein